MMPVQKCKGTRDLSPKEMARFRHIESIFRDTCLKWGYEEVRTPTLEYLYLFTAAGTLTPGQLGKVYSFLDWDGWSGERVVLRPDGTIPIARYYIETMPERETARLFYVANRFSFEETGRETRERWQFGAELIGPSSTAADTEMVAIALDVLKRLGIKETGLRLSHAGLIRTLLARFGPGPEEQHRLFDRMLDGDTQALTGATAELARALAPLLELKGKSPGFLKNMSALLGRDLPEIEAPLASLAEYASALDSLGTNYEIDIASGRGFEYYTGAVFQIQVSGDRVGGGGRYDALIDLLGGKDTPACGFAFFLDKLMDLIPDASDTESASSTKVAVRARTEPGSLKEAYEIVNALHEAGHIAGVHAGETSPEGVRWHLDLVETGPRFVLQDTTSRRRFKAATVGEVLTLLKTHRSKT